MKLQTQIPLARANAPIDYQSNLLLLGSCFVENIGEKLNYYKFRSVGNPLGILFHPLALEKLVSRAVDQNNYTEREVFFRDELWHCFDAHSDLSHISKEVVLQKLNDGLHLTHQRLKSATHLLITLGTAWAYINKETDKLVANCHKVPQGKFQKILLSVDEIKHSLERSIQKAITVNPGVQIIFTISPVRHLRDGFVENQLGKSHLITALHQVLKDHPQAAYFPAYEILMDELRDYRFYAADMVHPNALAIGYIWEKFRDTWIAAHILPLMEKVDEVQKGLLHRPFQPSSDRHRAFVKSLEQKISYLKEQVPDMEF
jgi:hypothetical protein